MVTIHPDRIALPTSRLPASLPAALVQSGLLATDTSDSGPAHGAFMAAGLVSGGQLQGREQARETITSGFAAVDALLPTGGSSGSPAPPPLAVRPAIRSPAKRLPPPVT